jgi:hypothetical protein
MRKTLSGTVILAMALLASSCGDDGGSPASPFDNRGGDQPPDAAEIFDELSNGEIDLGDLVDGDLGDIDLDELTDNTGDFLEGITGDGGGTVEVNGDTISFTSEICFAGQGDFVVEGGGETGDGTPAWVSINHTVDPRSELVEFLGEDTVQLIYGDADPIVESNIQIDYGRSDLFSGSVDGQPNFQADSSLGFGEIEIRLDGSSASGAGQAADNNFVLGDFEDRFDFSFTAACS